MKPQRNRLPSYLPIILAYIIPLLSGCETPESRHNDPVLVQPQPDPQTEYRLAKQEYDEALKVVEAANDQAGLNRVAKEQGLYQGSRGGRAAETLQDMFGVLATNDAERRLLAAKQRLGHAEAALKQNP
jgi:hypothetical protein